MTLGELKSKLDEALKVHGKEKAFSLALIEPSSGVHDPEFISYLEGEFVLYDGDTNDAFLALEFNVYR